MPIYLKFCHTCDEEFEVLASYAEAERMLCPECGSSLEKVVTAGTVLNKKKGFWKHDGNVKHNPQTNSAEVITGRIN